MTYRTAPEKPAEPPPDPRAYRCERCDVAVPRTPDARCPKCLRKTTLVDANGIPVVERPKEEPGLAPTPALGRARERPEIWPFNDTCPLCAARDVDSSEVFLRIAKVATGGGSVTASMIVRLRCCAPCRAHVVTVERYRIAALVALLAGMPLLLMFFVGTTGTVLLGVLGVVLTVGAFIAVRRLNHASRGALDQSGLTDELKELVPAPSGMFEFEHAVMHSKSPGGRDPTDLTEALRATRRRVL